MELENETLRTDVAGLVERLRAWNGDDRCTRCKEPIVNPSLQKLIQASADALERMALKANLYDAIRNELTAAKAEIEAMRELGDGYLGENANYKAALHDAKVEIEKGKADLKYYGELHTEEYNRIKAENERLMKAYPFHVWRKEKDALKAENERLREALEKILYLDRENVYTFMAQIPEIIRAALKGERGMTPEEVGRKWALPVSHPESWVQEDATYRDIYNRTLEEAAKVAELYKRDASFDDSQVGAGEHNANQANIAAAIRALKKEEGRWTF